MFNRSNLKFLMTAWQLDVFNQSTRFSSLLKVFSSFRSKSLFSSQYRHILFDNVEERQPQKESFGFYFALWRWDSGSMEAFAEHASRPKRLIGMVSATWIRTIPFVAGAHSAYIIRQTKMTIYFRTQPFFILSKRKLSQFLSKDSSDYDVGQDIHDHRRHTYADYDRPKSFFPINAE